MSRTATRRPRESAERERTGDSGLAEPGRVDARHRDVEDSREVKAHDGEDGRKQKRPGHADVAQEAPRKSRHRAERREAHRETRRERRCERRCVRPRRSGAADGRDHEGHRREDAGACGREHAPEKHEGEHDRGRRGGGLRGEAGQYPLHQRSPFSVRAFSKSG